VLVASLCADVRFFGLAQRMGGPAAGFLFLLGADWSGALVRPGFAGPWRLVLSQMTLSHIRWGLGSWEVRSHHGGLLCSLPAASDVTAAHTTNMGSWEVHSVVGLVSAGEDTLWGVLSLAGGMGRCAVLGCFEYE
jgi:hypothetical protein